MELLKAFLGGAGCAALVAGLFALVQWRLNRKAQKEDKAAERQAVDCAARGLELEKQRKMLEALMVAERTSYYDRIKHVAKSYIKRGWISVEEYEDLKRMHNVYHDKDILNGNGFLDDIMEEVNQLEKRVK